MAEKRNNATDSPQSNDYESLHEKKEEEDIEKRMMSKLERIHKLRLRCASLKAQIAYEEEQLRQYNEIKEILREMIERAEAAEAAKKRADGSNSNPKSS